METPYHLLNVFITRKDLFVRDQLCDIVHTSFIIPGPSGKRNSNAFPRIKGMIWCFLVTTVERCFFGRSSHDDFLSALSMVSVFPHRTFHLLAKF